AARVPDNSGLGREAIARIFAGDNRRIAVIGGKRQPIVAKSAGNRQASRQSPGVVEVEAFAFQRSAEIVGCRRNVEESAGESRRMIEPIAGVKFARLKARAEDECVIALLPNLVQFAGIGGEGAVIM